MRILGIESSCDETAAAILEVTSNKRQVTRLRVLSNVVASQVKVHAKTGGVVPEVAARAHVEAIIPVIQKALNDAGINYSLLTTHYSLPIDAIAVTHGPGLITSLRVGVDTARALAYAWKKPLVAVNHLEGHIYANWLPTLHPTRYTLHPIRFPALVLIVSGGHTELVLMKKHLDYKIIGATRDDAAGEAFDKVAKLLGLGYPGGPEVSKLAEKGNNKAIDFPRPMIDSSDFDFSFSGLKTSVLYYLKDNVIASPEGIAPRSYGVNSAKQSLTMRSPRRSAPRDDNKADICASFEQAAVDVLVAKTIRAAKKYKVKTVLLGGGVAANRRLRDQLGKAIKTQLHPTRYTLPPIEYTGDNAAMIAAAGAFHTLAKDFTPWQKIEADPNLSL